MNTDRDPFSPRPRKPRPYWPVIVVALLVPMAVVLLIDDLRIGLAAQISRLWPAQSQPARPAERRRPEAGPAASTSTPPDPNVDIVRGTPVRQTALPVGVETPVIAGAGDIGPRRKVNSPECRDIDRQVAELDLAGAKPLRMAEQERIRADRRWLRNRQVALGCS